MAAQEQDWNRRRMEHLARQTRFEAEEMDQTHPIGSPEDAASEFARNQAELNQIMVKTFTAINGRLEAMTEDVEQVKEGQEAIADVIAERFDRLDKRFDKLDRQHNDLRGAHAVNAVQRYASLIADEMGYQVITQLPREGLIGFSNMARTAGKSDDDIQSFREADLVMLVQDDQGQPAYIAVEASFTVGSKDIRRAKRNAEYLHKFTGLPAKGAVAGVDIARDREQNAYGQGVYCYHIPQKYLTPD